MQAGTSPPTVGCVAIQFVTPCDARIHTLCPASLKSIRGLARRIGYSRVTAWDLASVTLSQWRCICDSMRCYPWSSHSCTVMQTATCPHLSGHFQGMRQFVLVTNQLTQSPWLRPGSASVTNWRAPIGRRQCYLPLTPLLPDLPIGQWPAQIFRKSAIKYPSSASKDIHTHGQGVSQSLSWTIP